MKKLFSGNLRVMVVAVIVAVVVGGSAYAAGAIDGRSLKPNSVALSKLTKQARQQLSQPGPAGPQGVAGPQGPQGLPGDAGPQGAAGKDGVDGEDGDDGAAGEDGEDGLDGEDGEDGEDGKDGEQGPPGPTEHSYGVSALYLDGTYVPASASWTPTVPRDHNNAAQSSGSTVITCAATCELTSRAVIRTDDPTLTGQAGGGVLVTGVDGALVAAGKTPANPLYGNSSVVDVATVGLGSKAPTQPALTGTEVPIEWTFGPDELPAGTYLVSGTIQFFEFIEP